MTFFQIDWITIDIIIIFLLLLLLIGVRIIKITHRWRYSFSNEALEYKKFSTSRESRKNQTILSKKWCLTRNSILKNNLYKSPVILIIRTKIISKLLKIITEGLSSYGFDVINMKVKFTHELKNKTLENSFVNEWLSSISDIFENFKIRETLINSNYVIIDYSKKVINYEQILTNPENKGIITINPKITSKFSSEISKFYKTNSPITKVYTIFSRNSILFFKNKHLKRFLKNYNSTNNFLSNCITIENTNNSFKYYETILLGVIIDIIENKLQKSEI
ncbi:MAG: hypothetical protein R3255_02330 [Candidatus Lokiarchaeia archaeon]|nr:hypothetical protein [Candidatus Lokiarchaeia archaeon]